MPNLKMLLSKLNIHGAIVGNIPGSEAEITTQDVYAALAMGGKNKLSKEAFTIGCAVYAQSAEYILDARKVAFHHIEKMMKKKGWDPEPPFIRRVDDAITNGRITEQQRKEQLFMYVQGFKWDMAKLAIRELIEGGKCIGCNGTGVKNSRRCSNCGGSRMKPLSLTYKTTWCLISKQSWRNTWDDRFKKILSDLEGFKQDFKVHLTKHCR